jgi:hypothetical protein
MNWNIICETPRGRIVDPGNERHQRITRINRSPNRLHYSAAVTDADRDGCRPPNDASERILGFVIQVTEEDIGCERACLPNLGFYPPGDAALITLNERIRAFAACDVCPGDAVMVEPLSGLPAAQGIVVAGATWESNTMSGMLGVIQVNTRTARHG